MLIQTVEVKNLWGKDILWDFNEDVNVLIGENGVGKSTVLRLMSEAINPVDNIDVDIKKFDIIDEIVIKFTNGIVIKANSSGREIIGVSNNNYSLNFSHIDTFDVLEKSPDPNLTYLDYLIAKLEGKFVKYQRDIATEVERVFMSEDRSTRADKLKEIEKLYDRKNIFLKIIKEWFGQGERNKIFDDKRFLFITNDSKEIIPKFLSSGEKQALIIFLTVLLENEQDFILIMDEPEISLHISWQRHLINKIRELNPNCQLIISTHSPTVFYASWQDNVIRFSDICSDKPIEKNILKANNTSKSVLSQVKDAYETFEGAKENKLYKINNNLLKNYSALNINDAEGILDFLKDEADIYPDNYTYSILISRMEDFEGAKKVYDFIGEEKYSRKTHVKPNQYTLNALLQKVSTVNKGIELIREISASTNELSVQPGIISFSILLGKARNTDEIKAIEEHREFYGIEPNEIYKNKLKTKQN